MIIMTWLYQHLKKIMHWTLECLGTIKLLTLQQKLSLTSLDISHKNFRNKLEEHCISKISDQLKNISNNDIGKLTLYSTIINLNIFSYHLKNKGKCRNSYKTALFR
jgi:hypothetical protein